MESIIFLSLVYMREKESGLMWRDEVTMGSIFLSSAKLGEGTDLVGVFEFFFIKLLNKDIYFIFIFWLKKLNTSYNGHKI